MVKSVLSSGRESLNEFTALQKPDGGASRGKELHLAHQREGIMGCMRTVVTVAPYRRLRASEAWDIQRSCIESPLQCDLILCILPASHELLPA
jgi:hypothetical protein